MSIYLDEEGRGFESRRGHIQDFVIFCRDEIVEKRLREEKLETPDFRREMTSTTETRQEAIRINLLRVCVAIYQYC